jgi:hypothetical protein
MLAAVGMAGFGDLVEQCYICMSWCLSFSLFTMPDFIDWPDEWLTYFGWMHSFSFGLDFGLLVPSAPDELKFALKLLPSVLVLLRAVWLMTGIFQTNNIDSKTASCLQARRWLSWTWPAPCSTASPCTPPDQPAVRYAAAHFQTQHRHKLPPPPPLHCLFGGR